MQEGWSTAPDNVRNLGFGAGMGLPNIKKYTDEFPHRHRGGRGHYPDHDGVCLRGSAIKGGDQMERFFHSVTLDSDKCMGCTNCIKHCPTEAIRVRSGKACIISERCIDCGECVRVCPHHAKRAQSDPLSVIESFPYAIALPAPTLYGQFNHLDDIDIVLTGLKRLGFDEVFEVSRAAELVSEATRRLMREGKLRLPVISSACPAVVRLIRVRFPDLCGHVLPLASPMELAARTAKDEVARRTGLPREQIGAFFLTPCPAKVTDARTPINFEHSEVDGVIAISEIFPKLLDKMDHLDRTEPLQGSGVIGVSWASSGGESAALLNDKYLAADGVENVIRVLEEARGRAHPRAGVHRAERLLRRLRGRRAHGGKPVCRACAAAAAPALSAGVAQPPGSGRRAGFHALAVRAGIRAGAQAFRQHGGGAAHDGGH